MSRKQGQNSDDDMDELVPKKNGRAHANMTPAERDAMIEWLEMDREGQKDGQPMQNWRSICGGAAKGRSMGDDADEVHAKGGFMRLSAFVNVKCKIKTDKKRAWDEEIAEKRWTALKKAYKKASKIPTPLNTHFLNDEDFEEAKKKVAEEQEKCCYHFQRLHTIFKHHPGMHPHMPTDSMALEAEPDGGELDEPLMRHKEDTMGIVRKRKDGGEAAVPMKKKKTEEFHLRKPGVSESTGKKRMSIHEMFIECQMKQAVLDRQKLMVEAISKLAAANIPPTAMGEYLKLMGLGASASDPVKIDSDKSDSDSV